MLLGVVFRCRLCVLIGYMVMAVGHICFVGFFCDSDH